MTGERMVSVRSRAAGNAADFVVRARVPAVFALATTQYREGFDAAIVPPPAG